MEILSRAHAEEAVLGVVCWQIGRGERDLGGAYRRSLSEEPIGGVYRRRQLRQRVHIILFVVACGRMHVRRAAYNAGGARWPIS